MCVYLCICMCISQCVCLCVHVCVCTHMYLCASVCVCACLCLCVSVYAYVCVHTCTCAYVRVYLYHNTHVEFREQHLGAASLLLPHASQVHLLLSHLAHPLVNMFAILSSLPSRLIFWWNIFYCLYLLPLRIQYSAGEGVIHIAEYLPHMYKIPSSG